MSAITSLFKTQAGQTTVYTGLQLNTSVLGACIPLVYGVTRVGINVIWYGDFVQTNAGGKGGGKGAVGQAIKGGGGASSPSYQSAVALALCEGPITGINAVWVNKGNPTLSSLGLSLFTGTYPQSPWGYLESNHQGIDEQDTIPSSGPYSITVAYTDQPFTDNGVVDVNGNVYASVGSSPAGDQYVVNTSTGTYTFNAGNAGTQVTISYEASNQQPPNQAVGYNGIAYLAGTIQLGQSAQVPQITCEVQGLLCGSAGLGGPDDADPSQVVTDLLTNGHYGAGYPSSKIGALTGVASSYQNYCLAQGFLISPAYTSQQTVAQMLNDIATATNSAITWNGGLLNFVPYGDAAITATGYNGVPYAGGSVTYTPNLTPVAILTVDDFVQDTGSIGDSSGAPLPQQDPVAWHRKRPADRVNSIKVEWLDRNNSYNTSYVTVENQALIDQFSRRQNTTSAHLFCLGAPAYASAFLQLQRQAIMNTCSFALDARYAWLDCMDIIQVPDPAGTLVNVRITAIQENDDDTFSFAAEEVLQGSGTAVANDFQGGYNSVPNYDNTGGNVNTPLLWEPPVQLVSPPILPQNTPEIWIATSGENENYGGCIVNISLDGTTYTPLGDVVGNALQGQLPGSLNAFAGTNPDATDTARVDLTQSDGVLDSVTAAEAQQAVTLALLDYELFTYVDATLDYGNQYTLSNFYRGLYGTAPVAHSSTPFTQLTQNIFKYSIPINLIGSTVYFKFQSFNRFGRSGQSLSACTAYPHTVYGSGFFGSVSQALSIAVASLDEGLASASVSQSDDEGIASDPYYVLLDEGLASA